MSSIYVTLDYDYLRVSSWSKICQKNVNVVTELLYKNTGQAQWCHLVDLKVPSYGRSSYCTPLQLNLCFNRKVNTVYIGVLEGGTKRAPG